MFSISVGGDETYEGRSYMKSGVVVVVVEAPRASGWLIADPFTGKPGECRRLFGSDGSQETLRDRWKAICR